MPPFGLQGKLRGCRWLPVAMETAAAFALCSLPLQTHRQRDGGVRFPLALNRVLVEPGEVNWTSPAMPEAVLAASDVRSVHIREVLQKESSGDVLRAGVADRLLVDSAPVRILEDKSVSIKLPKELQKPLPPRPPVTLVLAIPRPKVLVRLLPQIAAVGVKHIVLVNAYKVERCYFDSDVIRKPEMVRAQLFEGVMQSGVDGYIPTVSVEKRLKVFLEDTLDDMVPQNAIRILAEPDADARRIVDAIDAAQCDPASRDGPEVVVAVGPEGGWMPRELSMMEERHGFQRASMGSRVLRTDAAVLILLGLIHDALAGLKSGSQSPATNSAATGELTT